MKVKFLKSDKPDKRLKAVFNDKKTIHFGLRGGSTFIDHKDTQKKKAWMARHRVRENWDDPMTAGALSRWVLWNKTDLNASIRDFKNKFNLS